MTRKTKAKSKHDALTRIDYHTALVNLDTAFHRYLNAMCCMSAEHDQEFVLRQLFPPNVIEYCDLGYRYCAPHNRIGRQTYDFDTNVAMLFEGTLSDNQRILCPNPDFMNKNLGDVLPGLMTYFKEVKQVCFDFAKVKYVLMWFNATSTGAGLRNYCPWIKMLLPSERMYEFNGGRWNDPAGLAAMLPLTREVAGFMSSVALMGSMLEQPKPKLGLNLTFSFKNESYMGHEIPIVGLVLDL